MDALLSTSFTLEEAQTQSEIEYSGVQVDNCFNCGGMFLDAGEAEKIMAFEEPGTLGKMFGYLVGKS